MQSTWAGIPPIGVAQSVILPDRIQRLRLETLDQAQPGIWPIQPESYRDYEFRPPSQRVELTRATAETSHPSQIRICGASLKLSHITIIPVQLKAR